MRNSLTQKVLRVVCDLTAPTQVSAFAASAPQRVRRKHALTSSQRHPAVERDPRKFQQTLLAKVIAYAATRFLWNAQRVAN
jgi:hypothetical protein